MSQSIFPVLRYRDPHAGIDFLVRAFGFERKAVYEDDHGAVVHAELRFGESLIMLGGEREDAGQRAGTAACYLVVADPDAHHDRTLAAGAEITMELTDQDYGSRDYGARDPEGNLWSFGTYDPAREG